MCSRWNTLRNKMSYEVVHLATVMEFHIRHSIYESQLSTANFLLPTVYWLLFTAFSLLWSIFMFNRSLGADPRFFFWRGRGPPKSKKKFYHRFCPPQLKKQGLGSLFIPSVICLFLVTFGFYRKATPSRYIEILFCERRGCSLLTTSMFSLFLLTSVLHIF
jgi:hypothetical protein